MLSALFFSFFLLWQTQIKETAQRLNVITNVHLKKLNNEIRKQQQQEQTHHNHYKIHIFSTAAFNLENIMVCDGSFVCAKLLIVIVVFFIFKF